MSEVVTITCDKCGGRLGKRARAKVRFGREAGHSGLLDLCRDCAEALILAPLGLADPALPFGPKDEPAALTSHPARERRASDPGRD